MRFRIEVIPKDGSEPTIMTGALTPKGYVVEIVKVLVSHYGDSADVVLFEDVTEDQERADLEKRALGTNAIGWMCRRCGLKWELLSDLERHEELGCRAR